MRGGVGLFPTSFVNLETGYAVVISIYVSTRLLESHPCLSATRLGKMFGLTKLELFALVLPNIASADFTKVL